MQGRQADSVPENQSSNLSLLRHKQQQAPDAIVASFGKCLLLGRLMGRRVGRLSCSAKGALRASVWKSLDKCLLPVTACNALGKGSEDPGVVGGMVDKLPDIKLGRAVGNARKQGKGSG